MSKHLTSDNTVSSDSKLNNLKSSDLTLNKLVFNVSKDVLEYLTGKVSLYKSKVTKINKCINCSIIKLSNNEIALKDNAVKEYCANFCNRTDIELQHIFTRHIKRFKNKKIKPSIYNTSFKSEKSIKLMKSELSLNKDRFSALQIKQALLYYYLCNSNGIIRGVEKKKLAESLNCTVKTIENNNKVFSKHNLFTTKRDCAGSIYVRINNYEEQHEQGGKGYMPFVSSVLKKILNDGASEENKTKKENKIKDCLRVNELRFLLKALAKFDFNFKKKHKTKFMFNEIKTFLATNFHNLKALTTLTDILNNMFNGLINVSIVGNDGIEVDLVPEVHGKFVKDKNLEINKALIEALSYSNNFMYASKKYAEKCNTIYELETKEEILQNLGELTIDYGYELVEKQLLSLNEEMGSIKNFGGFIRDKIKKYLNINRAYLKLI